MSEQQRINIDMTDLEDLEVDFTQTAKVAAGELLLRINKISLKRSSNDNRMLVVSLKVVGGSGEFEGRTINDTWMLEPEDSLFGTRKALQAFIGGDQDGPLHLDAELFESLLDQEAWCFVLSEKGQAGTAYADESFPRVKKYGIAAPAGEATF